MIQYPWQIPGRRAKTTTVKSIDKIEAKILDRESLAKILEKEKKAGKKLVFTNGCFDILHRGHIEYLSNASDLGDIFIIGLNSDLSVRKLKGENRPAIDEESRSFTLASFEFVDFVVLFDEDEPSVLMQALYPDIWVKGGDYTNIEDLPEYKIFKEIGGEVVVLPFVEGYSTTDIYNKILGSAKS
jgi:rfaE bifunctional protein nucleotidyltransferase chain/domain